MPTDDLGVRGEQLAEQHLRSRGLRTLARRFATPAGELDLVMSAGRTIVFVEVKTQADARWLDPHERVTPAKQQRLARAARWFLRQKNWHDRPCRFDVVSVILPPDAAPRIDHFEDAFTPDRW